jgi:hypothetical protein
MPTCSRVVVIGAFAFTAVVTISEKCLFRATVCAVRLALLVFIADARRLKAGFFVDFFERAVLPCPIGFQIIATIDGRPA